MSTGALGSLNGWVPSPNDAWHQDISAAPVASNSSTIVSAPQDLNGAYLHPDFGSPAGGGAGIPYTVVDTSTAVPLVPISASLSADSDNTLYPMSANMPIEGSPGQCWTDSADHHAIVIDKNQCVGYEVYQANLCNGSWSSYANVVWDFNTTEQRPYGLTSTDAAGLSVFEGLVRYDEIVAGSINHAIRFTAQHTKTDAANGYFTAPATHAAGNLNGTENIMGMRIRLKANFDVSGFSSTNQIILNAMKKYGMILVDNGSNMFFQGTPDPRWNDSDLHALAQVPSTGFEVVQMGPVHDAKTAPTGPAPVINSFTASSSTVAPGGAVTLTSNVSNASYQFIDKAGVTRGSVTVSPTQTTTYTLTARNVYGTSTASTTVTVSANVSTTLAFNPIASIGFGAAPFTVSSTSNSPGAITYTAVSGPATVSGNTVTVTGVGTVTIRATQAASGSYPAATTATTFTVNAAAPSLSFATIAAQTVGASPFSVSANSNSTGAITYSVVSGPATIAGNTVTIAGAGTVTLMASQAAAGTYSSGAVTTSFNVAAAPVSTGGTQATTSSSGAASTSTSNPSVGGSTTTTVAVSAPTSSSGTSSTTTAIGGSTTTASDTGSTTTTPTTTTASDTGSTTTPTTSTASGTGANTTPTNTTTPVGGGTSTTASDTGSATTPTSTATPSSGTTTTTSAGGAASTTPSVGGTTTTTSTGGAASTPPSSGTTTTTSAGGAASTTPSVGGTTTTTSTGGSAPTSSGGATSTTPTTTTPTTITPRLTLSSQRTKFGYRVNASSNSPGAITYSVVSGAARISGNNVYPTGFGTIEVFATQAASGRYSATSDTIALQVMR